MSSPLPDRAARRMTTRVLSGVLAGAVVVGGGVAWAVSRTPSAVPVSAAHSTPVPSPVVTTVGQVAGRVPWDKPLMVSVTDGTIKAVRATDVKGRPVDGELATDGSWTSAATLLPASFYRVSATVVDKTGRSSQVTLSTRTSLPFKTLHAVLSPGDNNVVGVGMTVVVTLDRAITSLTDRAAVVSRLAVTTTPAVEGAWRWMSATELHYRGATYWAKGTAVKVHADFDGLHLSDDAWGQGVRDTSYTIGSRIISTVDVTKHVMTVVVDGALVRTVKVSTGRDIYPTKGGVHLVLEKTKLKIMDSSTVGIPRNGPDGYYEKVPNSVRISYGGAFVHSADWSVRDQGVRNVSHGCVNLSPTDAAWFFDLVKRGDVVDVIHAAVGPKLSDPGMSDWNVPFASWAT